MEKVPTNTVELIFFCAANVLLGSLCYYFPEITILWGSFMVVINIAILVHFFMSHGDTKDFLKEITGRNSLEVWRAIEMLEAYHIADPDAFRKQEPWWTLISIKIYEDLEDMEFIREFCPLIAKNQRINGAYTGRFVEQGHGNAIRALWERQKMVISKPSDEGVINYFLDALEACLACVQTGVVGKTMATEEYKTIEDLLKTLDGPTLKKALNEWPKIRTQEEKALWEHQWDGLWSHFREKYMEAVPVPAA